MREITKYEAEDGTVYDTPKRAHVHDLERYLIMNWPKEYIDVDKPFTPCSVFWLIRDNTGLFTFLLGELNELDSKYPEEEV